MIIHDNRYNNKNRNIIKEVVEGGKIISFDKELIVVRIYIKKKMKLEKNPRKGWSRVPLDLVLLDVST